MISRRIFFLLIDIVSSLSLQGEYWEIVFRTCYRVQYETDATWRTIPHVKDMTRPQRGSFCQNIQISSSKAGFMDITMDLSIMDVQITCKETEVTQKPR